MAVLLHGSDASKDGAIQRLIELAMQTGEASTDQARLFRSAVVAGGALPALVAVLSAPEQQRQLLAAAAIHALAIDDPTTDEDNFHQFEICQSGAVEPLVRMLGSEDPRVQMAVTGPLSALAENPSCQTMIVAAGAITPLMAMAQYGSDMQKLGAMAALDVLAINNAASVKQLKTEGAGALLGGLSTVGSPLLREQASDFGSRLDAPPPPLSPRRRTSRRRARRVSSTTACGSARSA